MKLVFPGGEHPQVLLGQGVNNVGSDPRANIVIDRPGVMPQHCQLHVTPHGVMLDVPSGADVSVNGRPVAGLIALRRGDAVAFTGVEARLSSVDAAGGVGRRLDTPEAANDGAGVTAVRAVLPRYVLRAVSGNGFGRNYPLSGATVIGRAPESTIRLDETGISRMHARLVPTDEGVMVEDLNSTNGTFVNGKRVLREEARVGDELGFDTLRFRLAASNPGEPILREDGDAPTRAVSRPLIALVVVLAAAVAAALVWRLMG